MKALLLLPALTLPLLFTGCETLVVERPPTRRVAVVEREYPGRYDNRYDRRSDRYDRRYDNRYDRVDDRRDRRDGPDVVIVNPRPTYRPATTVRYYNDSRGRYYIREGRRVYVNAGTVY